jgi:hypothetical protein
MFTWTRNLDANSITAIASAAISCVALFVSLWTAAVSARHNRIATRPQLRIDYRHGFDGPLVVVLSNRGLGPAVIDRFAVMVDSEPIQDTEAGGLRHALETVGVSDAFYAYTPSPTDVISPGEELLLLELPISGDLERRREIARCFARIAFVIESHSTYRERDHLERNGNGMPLVQRAGNNRSRSSVAQTVGNDGRQG